MPLNQEQKKQFYEELLDYLTNTYWDYAKPPEVATKNEFRTALEMQFPFTGLQNFINEISTHVESVYNRYLQTKK